MKTRYLLVVSLFALSLPMCRDEEPAIKAEPSGAALAGAAGGAGQAGGSSAAGRAGGGLDAAGNGAAGEVGNAGRAGNAGHAGSAGRAPFAACPPDLPGPVMVQVPVPGGQTDYCIDTTEVTQAQYAAFLAAKGDDVSGQRDACAWNKTYAPPKLEPGQEQNGECESPEAFDPEHRGNYPMACVDFCDAAAYCQWAGKRLCGKIGGGSVEKTDGMNAAKSQWYNACSMGGQHRLPYGNEFVEDKCNLKTSGMGGAASVQLVSTDSDTGCHADVPPMDRIRDMVGNISEWEDSCFFLGDAPFPNCAIRGGDAHTSPTGDLGTCLEYANAAIYEMNTIGFRCCLD